MWECLYTNLCRERDGDPGFRVTTEHYYRGSAEFDARIAAERGYTNIVVRRADHLAEITKLDRPEVQHRRAA